MKHRESDTGAREVNDAVRIHNITGIQPMGGEGAAQRVVWRVMETKGWIILGGLVSIF